jgi:hypothetical protein
MTAQSAPIAGAKTALPGLPPISWAPDAQIVSSTRPAAARGVRPVRVRQDAGQDEREPAEHLADPDDRDARLGDDSAPHDVRPGRVQIFRIGPAPSGWPDGADPQAARGVVPSQPSV